MNHFSIPRDIFYGKGSLEQLARLEGKRAVIITGGKSMRSMGALERAECLLQQAGMEVKLLEGVEPDPSLETVLRGAEELQRFEPDWIVGLGGGSAIDAAKAMWVFYEHPNLGFEQAVELNGVPPLRSRARFAAIPSTSGTASEVTTSAVISHHASRNKLAMDSKALIPDLAILDPDLACAMPARLAASTGMDALTHALEALVSTAANTFSSALAREAAVIIIQNLKASCAGDPDAREKMHYAQCMAGMAFSNSMLGAAHSLAHASALTFQLPHGLGNAIFLPHVLRCNSQLEEVAREYAGLARRLGLEGKENFCKGKIDLNAPGNTAPLPEDARLAEALCEAVAALGRNTGIPPGLKAFGVSREAFEAALPDIVQKALLDPCTETNPRRLGAAEMETLFRQGFGE
ncbi:MAG: iron-containing alcohol dehydrogenase [Desulfovibrionaceae bacterium]|nr:iron-containing alcohol dehydrogenase [Desulfovibrionaceae bacterium]